MYEARCQACGYEYDYIASIDERLNVPRCEICGGTGTKVILTAPTGVVQSTFTPFRSHVDGTMISNHRDLQNHNKRNGVVNLNDGFSEEKILAGDFGQQKELESLKDKAKDVQEAVHAVQSGYKPEVQTDE